MESGAIRDEPVTWKSRNANSGGTNPEELLAAALASCFAMALAFALEHSGYEPEHIDVTAKVNISTSDGTFEISGAELLVDTSVRGIDGVTYSKIAHAAKSNCPISMVLDLDIALDARLI
jgi:osmotically inducible protein OsmC